MRHTLVVLLALGSAVGCSSTINRALRPEKVQRDSAYAALDKQNDSLFNTPLRTALVVEEDRYRGEARVLGPELRPAENERATFFLRSWVNLVSGSISHQLYVKNRYSGRWRFYQSANGEDASPLAFSEIRRDLGTCSPYGCSHVEQFGAGLPDSLVRARASSGYAVKFQAKDGATLLLAVTPAQIAKQLKAVDSVKVAIRK
jgi:hypothetical protein